MPFRQQLKQETLLARLAGSAGAVGGREQQGMAKKNKKRAGCHTKPNSLNEAVLRSKCEQSQTGVKLSGQGKEPGLNHQVDPPGWPLVSVAQRALQKQLEYKSYLPR